MITSDGKIFGKINILDTLIVVAVIAAIVFLVTREGTALPVVGGGGANVTYSMSFFAPVIEPFVAEPIAIGDIVVQHGTEVGFGTVYNVQIREGIEFRANSEGVLIGSQWGDRVELTLTSHITLPAGSLDNGLMIQGNRFAIGQTVTIRAGDSVISLRISDL